MKKSITILLAAALMLCACKPESVHYDIATTQATLDITLSGAEIELDPDAEDAVALTLTCSNPEGLDLKYSWKMDLQSNNFVDATELAEMADGRLELTNSFLNRFLVDRGVNGGDKFTEVAMRIVGSEDRTDEYHKPVFKDLILLVRGYLEGPEKTVENVYMLGDACDAGWNIGAPIQMERDPSGAKIFTWRGHLYPRGSRWGGGDGESYIEGTIKFPVRTGSWECPFFMAPRANTIASGTSKLIYAENGQPDNKFLVNTYGLYNVTLSVRDRSVTFALEDSYPDLDIKRIWMVGDATYGGWESRPFRIELEHSLTERQIFTWEGELKAGEFKFPLNHTAFESVTIRPVKTETVDKDNPSPLVDGAIQNNPDSEDIKWKVTEETAGTYRITINTENMTIKFEKK